MTTACSFCLRLTLCFAVSCGLIQIKRVLIKSVISVRPGGHLLMSCHSVYNAAVVMEYREGTLVPRGV